MKTIIFWDKNIRSWTVYVVDAEGNQVGDAEYFANRAALKAAGYKA